MLKRLFAPLFLTLFVFLPAGHSPASGDGSVYDPDTGWRTVRIARKFAFRDKRHVVLSNTAQIPDEELSEAGHDGPGRKRLVGTTGYSSECTRNAGSVRAPGGRSAEDAPFAWFLDLNVPRVINKRLAAGAAPQPMAVIMPIPRSPPAVHTLLPL